MSLVDQMKAHAEQHATSDPAILAKTFMGLVRKDALTPLVENEFWRLDREQTRKMESKAIQDIISKPTSKPPRTASSVRNGLPAELRSLLDREYRDGSGESRRLRYMSIEEHQTRIDMLMAQRDGIDRSIELHERAIQLIRTAGATCLDDIDTAGSQAA